MSQIIRIANKSATDYQYEAYKNGWILEVIHDFGEYYTAKVLTGSLKHTDNVIAVHKGDCETKTLGSAYGSESNTSYGPMIGSEGEYGESIDKRPIRK